MPMKLSARVSALALMILALPLAALAQVNYNISGTLSLVSGSDDLNLNGDSITATANLSQSGTPSTGQGASQLTILNVTGVQITVSSTLNCGNTTRVQIIDNVSGADSLSIQNCTVNVLMVPVATVQADISLNSGGLFTAVPAAFTSASTSGTITVDVIGKGPSTYSLQNASASASGTPPPTITPNPSSWSPSAQQGSTTALQTSVTLSSSGAPASYATSDNAPWLTVAPGLGNTNTSLTLFANPSGLAEGTYNGTVTITSAQTYQIPVTFTITGLPKTLTANPTSLTFNHTAGLSPPVSQDLFIDVSPSSATTVNASVTSGGSWLSINPSSASTPGQFTVSVNPAGQPVGSLPGNIQITASGVTNSPLNIPVTLVIAGSTLSVPNSPLSFNYTLGASAPAAQQVTIGGTAGVAFTTSASTISGGNWLQVTPTNGNVSQNISVSINTAGLAAGNYTGTVTVTAPGSTGSPGQIPVNLTVVQPTLNATPNPLSFSYTTGGAIPAAQNVSLTGTNVSSYTAVPASTGNWLAVNPTSGSVPSNPSISVTPGSLAAGMYSGTVTFSAPGATPVVVNVNLTVTDIPTVTATPDTLTFNYQIGSSVPAAQQVNIGGSTGLSYTLSDDQTWLNLSSAGGTIPGSVMASVDPTGLGVGTYNGTITVTAPGASNSPRTVAVTLNVTPQPALNVNPTSLSFNYQINGSVPTGQAVSIGGTAVTSFTAVAASTGNWLSVTPGSGSIPGGGVTVSVDPTGLAPNTYGGTVTISATGATPVVVNVSFVVTPASVITPMPSSLTFDYQIGGSVPAAQTISIGGTDGLTYTLSDNQPWLNLDSAGGTTPGTVMASIDPTGLAVGTYTATIVVTSPGVGNSPQNVGVTLNVTPQPVLNVNPSSLSFSFQLGGSNPAGQTLSISGTSVSTFTALAASSGWLSVTPDSGSAPGSVTVNADPTGLAANTYNGTVTISAPGATPVVVNVAFLVSAAPTISATPGSLTFNYSINGAVPAAQAVAIGGTPGLAYTVSDDQPWLNLDSSGGTTPGGLMASVDPTGLAVGTYMATITVASGGASNSPQTVTVTLNVTPEPLLSVNPTSLTFSHLIGASNPAGQSLMISGTAISSFTAAAASSGWLSVTPGSGLVPGSVTVNVNAAGLAANTYNGTVTISAPGVPPAVVNVTLTVTTPTISATPGTLTFNYALSGSVPAAQQVDIGGTPGLSYSLSDNAPWLNLSSAGGTTPGSVMASIDPTGLAVGAYNAIITVTAPTALNSPQIVNVTLNVTPAPTINPTPGSLTFTYLLGGSVPSAQAVSIGGTAGLTYTLADDAPWLNLDSAGGTTPGAVMASVDPTGLAIGTYTGTITVTSAGASNSPQMVAVTLNVTDATLNVAPSSLSFNYSVGAPNPAAQMLNITGMGVTSFTAAASSSGWLSVNPGSGSIPGSVSVSVNPAGLSPNTYNGTVTITAGSLPPVVVNVSLLVTAAKVISAVPGTLTFDYQVGGLISAAKTFDVGGTAGLAFTVSDSAPWLSVNPGNGTTPSTLSASVDPGALAPGTYTATISVMAAEATNSPQTVSVVLNVKPPAALTVLPGSLSFNFKVDGANPAPQVLNITGNGVSNFTATAAGGSWLHISPGSGPVPGSVTVTVDPTGLAANTYAGTVTIAAQDVPPVVVNVSLLVSVAPTISASPSELQFVYRVGEAPPPVQNVAIEGTAVLSYTVIGTAPWLTVGPYNGVTPSSASVSVDPQGLNPGTYSASLQIAAVGAVNSPQTVDVHLEVLGASTVTVSPAAITFNHQAGSPNPPSQSLLVTGSVGQISVVAAGGSWLSATPLAGSLPANLLITANASGLPVGTYQGSVTISGGGFEPKVVPVTLTVSEAPQISTSAAMISFDYDTGGINPSPQMLTIGGTTGLAYTIEKTGDWFAVSPLSGAVPGSATITADATGLDPGLYVGTITIVAPGASNSPLQVPVQMQVSAENPAISQVVSFAAIDSPANAPGQLVYIFGKRLGSDPPVYFTVAGGKIPDTLGNSKVTLNNMTAIPLLSYESQMIAILPFSAPTTGTAQLQVEYAGKKSKPFVIPMAPSAVRVLTQTGLGQGPALAVNPDGTLNTASNPAPVNSFVIIYTTGGGVMDPPVVAGDIAGNSLSMIATQPVTATLDGAPAQLNYSGSAPGLAYGIYQFNLLTTGLSSGGHELKLTVGESTSQAGVTVYIQ